MERVESFSFHAGCCGNTKQTDDMKVAPNDHECAYDPIEIFCYTRDTFILRTSKCLHYEGNFLYLLFGDNTVLLHDTSALDKDALPLPQIVENLICFVHSNESLSEQAFHTKFHDSSMSRQFLNESVKPEERQKELLVVHSHCHSDHIAGDSGFYEKQRTTAVPTGLKEMKQFYGFTEDETQRYVDLGGRSLEVLWTPGHEPNRTDICFYDNKHKFVLTGDLLYPGRLYISNFQDFRESIHKLWVFSQNHDISAYLGSHIEIGTEGKRKVEYPCGTRYQPHEHPLTLSSKDLSDLYQFLNGTENPVTELNGRVIFDSFILHPNNIC